MGEIIPYDDRDGVIWWNGEFVPWREANVHILTHGLHYGSCVFEGERAYDGNIFKSRTHTERLHRSAELLGFELPYTVDEIETAKIETLSKSGLGSAYIRPVAWRGSEQMGVTAKASRIHVAIAIWHWGDYFANKMEGIRLAISEWRRPAPETAPVKSKAAGLYMICTLSKHAAEARGFNDALMYDYKGRVAECTGAHIFFGRDGELHTPTGDCLLDGITRRTILDIAAAKGVVTHERDIMPDELDQFDECFIVGTAAEVTPVREIEGRSYTPGRLCELMVSEYDALTRAPVSVG